MRVIPLIDKIMPPLTNRIMITIIIMIMTIHLNRTHHS